MEYVDSHATGGSLSRAWSLALCAVLLGCHAVLPYQAAWDEKDGGSVGDVREVPADGSQVPGIWVTIPAGTFIMGSPEDEPCRFPDEDRHVVTLTRGFKIQATEVTQGQFAALMGDNPSLDLSCGDDCPVDNVNWYMAAAYCNALSTASGKPTCYECEGKGSSVACLESQSYSGSNIYACPGYRLPTDAEWEYAYRAETETTFYNGVITSCGDDPNATALGWYASNSVGKVHPVGQMPANPWGLFDMGGNVWEWCHDWYREILGDKAATDPWGAANGRDRVVRGGGYANGASDVRAARRNHMLPAHRASTRHDFGFRPVRTLPP